MNPRVLLVNRDRHPWPLDAARARKYAALDEVLDWRAVTSGDERLDGADPRLRVSRARPVVDHLLLPGRVARALRAFDPDVVLVQGVHEAVEVLVARKLAGSSARVIVDVHGDWRQAARLYGSPFRRILAPVADALAPIALRRATAVRTVSEHTSDLVRAQGIEPAVTFPAYVDLEVFLGTDPVPLPEQPRALFVGVLERSKNVHGLVEAWRLAAPRVPDATLHVVGRGSLAPLVERLAADLPSQTRWTQALAPAGVAAALDDAWVLALPSRSEGLPRIVIEALARGRAVVGADIPGIGELVQQDTNGLLVDTRTPGAFAEALVRVLSNRGLAERYGRAAREAAGRWAVSPEVWARRMRELVDAALAVH